MKEFKEQFNGFEKESLVALVLASFFLVIFAYQGHPSFFIEYFGNLDWVKGKEDFYSQAYRFFFTFILFFIIPAIIVKFYFKKSLIKDYGLGLGDKKFGFSFVLLSFIILPLPLYINAASPDFLKEYPLWKDAGANLSSYFLWIFMYLFYYIGWEFFFRGFMQFSLVGKIAPFFIIMMQTLPSTIVHIGKPEGEAMSAIIAGLVFGAVALRTRSIWYTLLVHWYVGALTELFCYLHRGV